MANGSDSSISVAEVLRLIVDLVMMFAQFWYSAIEGIYLAIKGTEPVSVKDEIILITGSGHGIGRELSLQYAALGGRIVCVDINKENNDETVKEIKEQGGKAHGYVCDISNRDNVLDLWQKVRTEVGFVSILVNNAGIMPCKVLNSHSEAEIRKLFDINVLAHLWTMQSFGKEMAEKNRGHIVAMSSMAGLIGFRNLVPYCGSKYAVRGLMEAFWEELRTDGIDGVKFTTICPYMVDTGLCHNPIIRFKKMMPIVKPADCAAAIIKAQRTGVVETSVPSNLRHMNTVTRLFPEKCGVILKDFFSTGVGSHE